MTSGSRPAAGPPSGPPAAELIAAGFELENADAPLLHHWINLADLAHLLDLGSAGVIPPDAARRLLVLLLETIEIPASDFPYDPANGEPYNSRERYFVAHAGDVAGWLHAGRPRRGAPGGLPAAPAQRPGRPDRSDRRPGGGPGQPGQRAFGHADG